MTFEERVLDHPNMNYGNANEAIEKTKDYNCIAFAVDDTQRWWEPCYPFYWPRGAARDYTLEALIRGFRTRNYESCEFDDSVDEDYDKVAIYVDKDGDPCHVAKQLPNGRWKSKLGKDIDVEHDDLHVLEDGEYGKVVQLLKRPKDA